MDHDRCAIGATVDEPHRLRGAGTIGDRPHRVIDEAPVHEDRVLLDDGHCVADEEAQPELLAAEVPLAVDHGAGVGRDEAGVMAGKARPDIIEEVRPLGEFPLGVTEARPAEVTRRASHLLEAHHIGTGVREPALEFGEHRSAPRIQRHDPHDSRSTRRASLGPGG